MITIGNMRKLIGTLVTWLLLAAIPLQGQAATAALFCGAGHHGVLAQLGGQPASEQHAEIAADAHVATGEWLAITPTGNDPIAQEPVEQVSEWTPGQVNDDDKCSAYSAIASEPNVVQQTVVPSQAIPYTLASFVNCIPQRLDPPPRSVFA